MNAPAADRLPVLDRRRAGVLLHPTSLPGRGAFGAAGRIFIDWLAEGGFSVWQMLPLGPVGIDGSPYWVSADAAFNTALIDPDEAVDPGSAPAEFAAFCESSAGWLEDYALFAALSRAQGSACWRQWPRELRDRDAAALAAARVASAAAMHSLRAAQWNAHRQWQRLRAHAHHRGVRLFGDLPIYVAPDSVATWAQRGQFQLNADGHPASVAGVPPDYFSADGQLWGNPLYDWAQAERDGFAYWKTRLGLQLQRFDLLRIDHFRGLAGYWSVPAGALTAREGQWQPGPGAKLMEALRAELPDMPLVAEDLGVITPDVDALRHDFHLPGMRVLQFGFDGSPTNPHLPHNFAHDTVAYTGTHDNDTTLGWYRSLDTHTAALVNAYLGIAATAMPQALWRAANASVAQLAMLPLQDALALGSEARLNVPGTAAGNWRWRLPDAPLSAELATSLRGLNQLYGRI